MSTANKLKFGLWRLIKLNTGRWSAVWHAFEVSTEAFNAMVNEDQEWFDCQIGFARPEVHDTKLLALEAIQRAMEEESRSSHGMREYFDRELRKVGAAIAKAKRDAETVGKDLPEPLESTAKPVRSKMETAMVVAGFDPASVDLPLLVGGLVMIKRWHESEQHLSALRMEGTRLLASHQDSGKSSKEVL